MKAILLYRPNSNHSRQCEQYIADFKKQTNRDIELMDYDSVEGAEFARNRDITSSPALVVVDDFKSVRKQWLGEKLPLFNEVSAYLWDNA